MDIPELIKKECLRRGRSIKTIVTYKQCVKQFFNHCPKDPKEINKKDIQEYLDKLIENGLKGSSINVHLNALKFFYNEILHKRLMVKVRFSKTSKSLPTVLTKDEVKKIIDAIDNPKHKLMIRLMYSAGLRVNELINLKAENFEFSNNYGWVRNGKGNKDRLFILAGSLKKELMPFIAKECRYPAAYLFKGYNNMHMSTRSLQEIVKKAAKTAGIQKNVHPHTLRHSFATHLIENGYDVASVQFLLGHSNTNTTMQYVHMASPRMVSVASPLDGLI